MAALRQFVMPRAAFRRAVRFRSRSAVTNRATSTSLQERLYAARLSPHRRRVGRGRICRTRRASSIVWTATAKIARSRLDFFGDEIESLRSVRSGARNAARAICSNRYESGRGARSRATKITARARFWRASWGRPRPISAARAYIATRRRPSRGVAVSRVRRTRNAARLFFARRHPRRTRRTRDARDDRTRSSKTSVRAKKKLLARRRRVGRTLGR